MINYIKLIRPINILMIALVVCLMQFCVVNPIYYKCGVSIDLFPLVFSLLMVSILTIAAAGYVINDYFDTKIDEINKPSKVIVGKTVTRAQAGTYFQILLVIGNVAGIALAAIVRDLTLVFIYAGVSGILWFYSSSYKRQLLLGNIMIAICTFLCVFLVGYVSNKALILKLQSNSDLLSMLILLKSDPIQEVWNWILGFSLFAFLFTLVREMVKDIEDIEGDREMECRTMPIVWGVTASKTVITALTIVTMALVAYFALIVLKTPIDRITLSFAIAIEVLCLYFTYQLWTAQCRSGYSAASLTLKITMLVGMLYSVFS